MNYDRQILNLLMAVGERGISVSALTKHVYNQNCTFFSQPDLQAVKQYVRQYLLRNSKSSHSLVERTGRRGYYRLNMQNLADVPRLIFDFHEETADTSQKKEKPVQDFSLCLFPEDGED